MLASTSRYDNDNQQESSMPRTRVLLADDHAVVAQGLEALLKVASILHISPRTAESHKYEIMQTLGMDTTAALIQYAVRSKLVSE